MAEDNALIRVVSTHPSVPLALSLCTHPICTQNSPAQPSWPPSPPPLGPSVLAYLHYIPQLSLPLKSAFIATMYIYVFPGHRVHMYYICTCTYLGDQMEEKTWTHC